MIRYKWNRTYILQNWGGGFRGGGGGEAPETLENFSVKHNENAFEFYNFLFFLDFSFNFSPLLILQKIGEGGPQAPKAPAYAPVVNYSFLNNTPHGL